MAEREGVVKILLKHIDLANGKIERDKTLAVIESVPKQFQLVLWAIMQLDVKRDKRTKRDDWRKDIRDDRIFTGDVYNVYQDVCGKTRNEVLTQRRVGDILAEFDMLGIINAHVISKGRHGRTREIKLMITPEIREKAKEILEKSLDL